MTGSLMKTCDSETRQWVSREDIVCSGTETCFCLLGTRFCLPVLICHIEIGVVEVKTKDKSFAWCWLCPEEMGRGM